MRGGTALLSLLDARHRGNGAVDRLLGGDTAEDRRLRSLLMESHAQDGGELLSHIGTHVRRTRRQIARAVEVLHAYHSEFAGSIGCAYALATLLIRMMVRDGLEPQDLDPRITAFGLAAVAADCLAAFAVERLSDPSVRAPFPLADEIDIGVMGFVALLGRTRRPQMTARQLIKFARTAGELAVHKMQNVNYHVVGRWPPPGWSTRACSRLDGARIAPLTSIQDLMTEGRGMKNCLEEGYYDRHAALGRVALFSIRVGADRATLALEPDEVSVRDKVRLTGWRIGQLHGKANTEASMACTAAAENLVVLLNKECPLTVPGAEVRRREQVRAAIDRSRTFNADRVLAQERWDRIYAALLPRRLASISPSEIVDDFLGVSTRKRAAQSQDP